MFYYQIIVIYNCSVVSEDLFSCSFVMFLRLAGPIRIYFSCLVISHQVSGANQDLVETNINLQDRVKDTERHVGGDIHKVEKRLIADMSLCFSELNNLVNVCVQRAEGQDPNISALLGVKCEYLLPCWVLNVIIIWPELS